MCLKTLNLPGFNQEFTLPFSQFYDDCEENRRIKNYDTELAFPKPGRRARLAMDSQPQKQV